MRIIIHTLRVRMIILIQIVKIVPFIRITNIANTATAAAMKHASTKPVNSALSAAAQPPRNRDSSLG